MAASVYIQRLHPTKPISWPWNKSHSAGKIEVKYSLVWIQFEFSKRKTNFNFEELTMKKNYNFDDAIDFIFDGNQSDLPGLSSDEKESDEIEGAKWNNVSDDKPTDATESDNETSFAFLARASNQARSLIINAKQIMKQPKVYIVGEREMRSFVIIHFMINSLNHL